MEKRIKTLIKNECCNYDPKIYGKLHYCFADKEHKCRYFLEKWKRCRWFEKAVLPLKPKLEAEYHDELDTAAKANTRNCDMCNERFVPSNNRQVFCEECREKRDKRRKREWWHDNKGSD